MNLNDYITEGRYPGDISLETIGIEQAEEAYDIVKKIKEFVLSRINFTDT